jgi:chromosomal replication initiator protein
MQPNYHHVIMGLYRPQRCQLWPFELQVCPARSKDRPEHEVIEIIFAEVFSAYRIDLSTLRMKTRRRPVVLARQIAMYLVHKYTKMALVAIGELFGGFDHTTILHSCATVEDLKSTDKDYAHELTQLETKIKYQL